MKLTRRGLFGLGIGSVLAALVGRGEIRPARMIEPNVISEYGSRYEPYLLPIMQSKWTGLNATFTTTTVTTARSTFVWYPDDDSSFIRRL